MHLHTAHWQTAYATVLAYIKLNLSNNILKNTWATQHCATLHTCTHALLCATLLLIFCIQFLEVFNESLNALYLCFITQSILCMVVLQSLFERQGMTLHGGLHPGIERGHIPLPKGMSRTKSFGKTITHPVHIQIR